MENRNRCRYHLKRRKAVGKKIAMMVLRIESQLSIAPVVVHRIGMARTGMDPLFSTAAGKQQQGQKASYDSTK